MNSNSEVERFLSVNSMQTEFENNNDDELTRNWRNFCMVGIASTSAATSAWMHLTYAAIVLHTKEIPMTPSDKAETRRIVIQSIITSEKHCRDLLRLSTLAFESLLSTLKSNNKVKDYPGGSIEEQLITFLLILGHNFKNRVVSFLLRLSGETTSRYFQNILRSVILLEDVYVKQPDGEEIQPSIFNNKRFYPYFKDCLGTIDGTHVRVKISRFDAPKYRGRKDWPTQNVLGACTFDLKFTYILAGWEGSAADSRVLLSALNRDEPLVIPHGKYYLGDAGFGLTSKVLTPYGRTRYHLKEYSQRAPESPEELFNHRHSSLRNSIERAFGVLKKRFPIIASGSECHYSCAKMTNIILACTVLHNFMLSIDSDESTPSIEDTFVAENSLDVYTAGDPTALPQSSGVEYQKGQEIRDKIASEMWESYCNNS